MDITQDVEDNDGYNDQVSLIIVREQRVAKVRRTLGFKSSKDQRNRGDQADQSVAEDHWTTGISKLLQL